jgi:hypothetical protein
MAHDLILAAFIFIIHNSTMDLGGNCCYALLVNTNNYLQAA